MNNERWESLKERMFRVGTAECALVCCFAAMGLAVLFIAFGLWRTLLIVLLGAVGLFIGGVKDKSAFIGRVLGKILPGKARKPYTEYDPKLRQAVADAIHKYDEEKKNQDKQA